MPRRSETRRRTYLAAVATILPFWPVDLAMPESRPSATLALRIAWAGSFLIAAAIAGRVSDRTLDRMAIGAATTSCASMAAIIQLTGGAGSPYLYGLPLLPMLMTLVEPWEEPPTWAAGLTCAAGIVWIGIDAGFGASAFLAWVGGIGVATGWAIYGLRESRRQRQAAIDASRLAAIGRLAAGVAHEINNPLAFAKANLHFLREALPPGPEAGELREVADEALVGLERIRGIVLDLRGFSREEPDTLVPVDVPDAVDEALRISSLQLHARVRVVRDLGPELPTLLLARGRVVQVLVNLLVNAADALEGRPHGEIRVTAAARGGRVVLGIEDNGPGVPVEARKRLFQPFVTSKPLGKGLGLGLALSRDYVERMGGTLRYLDRPGGGARFEVDLPAVPDPEAAP